MARIGSTSRSTGPRRGTFRSPSPRWLRPKRGGARTDPLTVRLPHEPNGPPSRTERTAGHGDATVRIVGLVRHWLLVVVIPILAVGGAALAVVARVHDDPPAVEAAADPTPAPTPQLILVDVVGAVA